MRPRPIAEGEQENLREKREYEDVTSEFKLIFRLMEKKGNRTGDRRRGISEKVKESGR